MSDRPDYYWYHELGFIDNSRDLRRFRNAVKIFMIVKPHRKHIVPWDNTVAFDQLVLEFLEEHAQNYWGIFHIGYTDGDGLKYPEDRARIVEGLRNLLANKIREFNRTKGSETYSLTIPDPRRFRKIRRKRRTKRPSCAKQMERILADNVDDFEHLTFTQPKAERWPNVKHDDESATTSTKQEVGNDEHENKDQDMRRGEYKVEKLEIGMVKEEDRQEVHIEKRVKIETSE